MLSSKIFRFLRDVFEENLFFRKNCWWNRKHSDLFVFFSIFFAKDFLILITLNCCMRNFKDLQIWKLGYELNVDMYKVLAVLPKSELKNIVDQLRRAATSIPLNIAEGCRSQSDKVFFNHLNYAYMSSAEVEVLLMMCCEFGYIGELEFKELWRKIDLFNAKLYSFMKAMARNSFGLRQETKDKMLGRVGSELRKCMTPMEFIQKKYGEGRQDVSVDSRNSVGDNFFAMNKSERTNVLFEKMKK